MSIAESALALFRDPDLERQIFVGPHTLRPTAAGEAIGFDVTIHLTWHGRGMSFRALRKRADRHEPIVLRRLRNSIRQIARRHSPHEAAALEAEIAESVVKGWKKDDHFWCTIDVHVEVDPAVRKRLAAALDGSIDLLTHEAYSRRKAESARKLTVLWHSSLDKLGKDFTVRHAAHAADNPDQFAPTAGNLIDEHRQRWADLRSLLEQSVDRYQELGLYEFATAYDKALSGLMHYLRADEVTKQKAASNGAVRNGE